MRLKFWKREKKTPILKTEYLDDGTSGAHDYLSGVTNLGDLSMADNIPGQIKITKGQCMGFLKSGKQCSRNVDTVYCYQHKTKDRS